MVHRMTKDLRIHLLEEELRSFKLFHEAEFKGCKVSKNVYSLLCKISEAILAHKDEPNDVCWVVVNTVEKKLYYTGVMLMHISKHNAQWLNDRCDDNPYKAMHLSEALEMDLINFDELVI